MDDDHRRRLLEPASAVVMANRAIVPIWYRPAAWATKRGMA